MEEPNYYTKNGISPIGAMEQGLISKEQYIGFLIGNILKYVCRYQYKENPYEDLKKAKHYLELLIAETIEETMENERVG